MAEVLSPQGVQRIPTGISGFDTICGGGILEGGLYLVVGEPGSGKTVLANHICFEHVRKRKRTARRSAIYVTLLAESHGRMMVHMSPFDFFSSNAVGHELVYVGGYGTMEEKGLDGLLDLVREMVRDRNASLVIVDGLVSAEAMASSPLNFKRFIHQLAIFAHAASCTTWLLSSTEAKATEPEHTMVDGIFELHVRQGDMRAARELTVRKLRGVKFLEGRHAIDITKAGFVVYPRTEAIVAATLASSPASQTLVSTGVTGLDQMLGGGILSGSTTAVFGSSGTGKTSMALHFLCGAGQRDTAVFFGFYESPERLIGKARQLGLPIDRMTQSQRLQWLWRVPFEARLDEMAEMILTAVDDGKAHRVVIDGLGGFREAAFYPQRVMSFITALLVALRGRNVTTLATLETMATLAESDSVELPVSPLVENVICLRADEKSNRLRRLLSIRKVREGEYDASTRQFTISRRGITIQVKKQRRR